MSRVVPQQTGSERAGWLLAVAVACALAPLTSACREDSRPAGPQGPGLSSQAIYENPQAGFAVVLPRTWQGGYRIDAVSGDAAAALRPGARHAVTFHYVPLAAATPEQPLLRLFALAPGQHASREAVETVVVETGGRVVVAVLPDRNPFDQGSADAQRFEAMRLTVDQVRDAVTLR